MDLAKDLLTQGQDVAAEAELKKAVVYDPENEEAQLVWGLVFLIRAERGDRLAEIDNCLDGAEEAQLREQADVAMREAERHFAAATRLAPDYGDAWMNRGVVAMHFGDWTLAVEHLNQALANAARLTSEAMVHTNLGWARFKNNETALATTELLQATQQVPNLCIAHYRLGAVYFARERHDEAAMELSPYAARDGQEPFCGPVLEALHLGGQNSLRMQDIDSAVAWFQRCLEVAPRSCIARQCKQALAELGG